MPLEKVKKFLEDIEENEIHFKEHFYDKTRERPISKELVKEYLKKTDWLLKVEEQSSGREGEKKYKLWIKLSNRYNLVIIAALPRKVYI